MFKIYGTEDRGCLGKHINFLNVKNHLQPANTAMYWYIL